MVDLFSSVANNLWTAASQFVTDTTSSIFDPTDDSGEQDAGSVQSTAPVGPLLTASAAGLPTLITGREAQSSAREIANRAWQPPEQYRAKPGGDEGGGAGPVLVPKEGVLDVTKYHDVNAKLDDYAKNGKNVVATYGNLIFVGDPSLDQATQERYAAEAIETLSSTPSGRKLLSDLADPKAMPTIIDMRPKEGVPMALTPESSGLVANTSFSTNYNEITWDPNDAYVSASTGKAVPPAVMLGHEMAHVRDYADKRRANASADLPYGIITEPRAMADTNNNKIPDDEETATAVEQQIVRELGLPVFRNTYVDGPFGAIEVDGADELPSQSEIDRLIEDIRTGNVDWQS